MRIVKEIPEFASWKEIKEAVGDGPIYFVQTSGSWRTNYPTILPTAALTPIGDEEIHLVNAMRPYVRKERTFSRNIKHTGILLKLTPKSIEVVHSKKMSYRYIARMTNILRAYNLEIGYIPCGHNRGSDCVFIPHPNINQNPDWGWPRTQEFLMRGVYSVVLQQGLSFDYKGNCLTDKPPTLAQCKKMVESYRKRSVAASTHHRAAHTLGFYTGFETNGYPIPKDKGDENLSLLNQQAIALGYRNVGEAWEEGVPIVGEVDDEWMEFHKQGLTGLLADSIKESRKK